MAKTTEFPVAEHGEQIDINSAHAVDQWTERLHVSEAELRRAVAEVGEEADQVAAYLGQPARRTAGRSSLH